GWVVAGIAAGFAPRPKASPLSTFHRVTFRQGAIGRARFTPDGRSIVYSAAWDGRPLEIYSTRLDNLVSSLLGFQRTDLFSVSPSGELALSINPEGPTRGTLARAPM